MAEYINRKIAIYEMKKALAEQECDCEMIPVIFRTLENIPTVNISKSKTGWISVKDRLPKPDSGAYWVAKKKINGEWQMKMALFCDYGYAMSYDKKTDVTWRDWDYTKIVNVSYWMPLPEPPEDNT